MKQLISEIVAANPLQGSFIESSVKDLKPDEELSLRAYLAFCRDRGIGHEHLATCYNTIVKDTVREQLYFQRHGRYRYATYAEVAESVYQNDEYMRRYMFGLALTTYLWPNHRAIHRYFQSVLPADKRGNYLEVGPGHGVYFMTAMRACRFDRYDGIDISPTSVALTLALLDSGRFGRFANYEVLCGDFLASASSGRRYDAVVMGEVLEHVEHPEAFMRKIWELSNPDAFIFITTAINAPAIDHIHLFGSPAAVHELSEKSGFRVVGEKTVPYIGKSLDESISMRLPVNIALLLERAS